MTNRIQTTIWYSSVLHGAADLSNKAYLIDCNKVYIEFLINFGSKKAIF